jgi:predicted phosphodiesterase
MKTLTFISDTHCRHNEITYLLTGGDFLIHTGDWTNSGNFTQMREFLSWFSNQTQYSHRIFIAGNHELQLEKENDIVREYMLPSNCIYLQDSLVELEGINFYGTPVTPVFYNWAFNKTSEQLVKHFDNIPLKTNVLLTHGGSELQVLENGLDVHIPELKEKIKDLSNLKISAFGHIHHSYGTKIVNDVQYVNSAIVGEDYKVRNKPIKINL